MDALTLCLVSFLLLALVWGARSSVAKISAKSAGQLPYPPTVGLWRLMKDGIAHKFELHRMLLKWAKELGPIFSIHAGTHRIIMLNTSEIIQKAFSEVELSGRPRETYMLTHAKGKHGVVVADGPGWEQQRRFMIKTLRDLGVEKIYMEKFLRGEAEEFVENLKGVQGTPVPMNKRFYLPVLNSLWMILTGIRYDQEDTVLFKLASNVYKTIDDVGRLPFLFVHFFPWLTIPGKILSPYVRHIYNQFELLHKYLGDIVEERKVHFVPDNDNHTREDYLNSYLQEIHHTTDVTSTFHEKKANAHLIAVMGDFFIAGVETTATSLVWAALHLAREQDVQKKIQAELDHVVGTGRLPVLADRQNCPYTEAAINEILRITPVATVSVPHAALDDVNFNGYFIPKGSWILPAIGTVHRDPDVWQDPSNFRPERFLSKDEEGNAICVNHPSLIPFSLGRRKCLGEKVARDNMFLFVSSLCHTYDFIPDPKKPPLTLEVDSFLAFTPKPFACVFTERHATPPPKEMTENNN